MLANLKEPKKIIFLSVNFFLRLWLILAQDLQKRKRKELTEKLKKKKKLVRRELWDFFKGFKNNPELSLFLLYRYIMWVMG